MKALAALLIALFGLAMAVLGIALVLDLVSLRVLFTEMGLSGLLALTAKLHAMLRHRAVQEIELAFGLGGVGLLGSAAWWLWSRGGFRQRAIRSDTRYKVHLSGR